MVLVLFVAAHCGAFLCFVLFNWGWSGVAKVACILCHRGVQLRLVMRPTGEQEVVGLTPVRSATFFRGD